jgi:serine phosphatase RsbU (regulator of sigma subunit)
MDIKIQRLLKQDRTQNRDGMDLSLCVWDKKQKQLTFAGAKNPLLLIRNGEVEVVKGSKFSIGGELRRRQHEYKEHVFDIQEDTNCYIFSDGYQDQFGGRDDRKFMKKSFYKLLHDKHQEDMPNQKQQLEKALKDWQGAKRQTDDILVIGFKLNP